MQQLSGLLVGAAQGGHDLLDGEDDIHTSFFIQPAVLAAQAHTVKEQTVEHLGFCGNASEPFLREQHLGDTVDHTWLLSRSFGSPAARMTSLVHHPMQGAALP